MKAELKKLFLGSLFRKQGRTTSQTGFTLIETLIALMIMGAAIMLVVSAWSGNYARVRKGKQLNEAALLLELKMAELELELKGKNPDEIGEVVKGDFGKDYSQYRWELRMKEFTMPDLSSAFISRDEGADQNMLTMVEQMTDYIEKAVKEVKLTVFAKSGKKEIPYAVTTYWVDFNKPLTAPGTTQ